ncbi:hypothetical protein FACS1894184_11040 [Clostridia bacterium]|nr:hypothetical protein FACS1894184_11040 [Clostridia bacterium]
MVGEWAKLWMVTGGLLNTTVVHATVISNELPIDNRDEKQERFDVHVIADNDDC